MIHIFPDLKRHTPCRNLIEKRKVKKKKSTSIQREKEKDFLTHRGMKLFLTPGGSGSRL
jgi:hypothetical protein